MKDTGCIDLIVLRIRVQIPIIICKSLQDPALLNETSVRGYKLAFMSPFLWLKFRSPACPPSHIRDKEREKENEDIVWMLGYFWKSQLRHGLRRNSRVQKALRLI